MSKIRESGSKVFSFFLLFHLVIGSSHAEAFGEKQEEKERTRWSLSQWLDTRDRMRMMDLWLALHSPTPYEFYISGSYQFGRYRAQQNYSAYDLSVAAYASIFGLAVEREFSDLDPRWLAVFHLRLFGLHDQGTNLTFEVGAKDESVNGSSFWGPVAGGKFTLYLTKFFGIEGLFRYSFSATDANGITYSGTRWSGGAFIDFNFVRVFADFLYESENQASANPVTVFRSGGNLGAKIYF